MAEWEEPSRSDQRGTRMNLSPPRQSLTWITLLLALPTLGCSPFLFRYSAQDADSELTKKSSKKGYVKLTPEVDMCLKKVAAAQTDTKRLGSGLPHCSKAKVRENDFCVVDLHTVRPTQFAVGQLQVSLKSHRIDQLVKKSKLEKYLRRKPIPLVRGKGKQLYLIDHHHLGSALLNSGVQKSYGVLIKDLSALNLNQFWKHMRKCEWVYEKKPDGETIKPWHELPKSLLEMADDPYRSLAGFVRRAEGFDKVNTPFVEFIWADFFRSQESITPEDIENQVEKTVLHAAELAKSAEARELPGHVEQTTPTVQSDPDCPKLVARVVPE